MQALFLKVGLHWQITRPNAKPLKWWGGKVQLSPAAAICAVCKLINHSLCKFQKLRQQYTPELHRLDVLFAETLEVLPDAHAELKVVIILRLLHMGLHDVKPKTGTMVWGLSHPNMNVALHSSTLKLMKPMYFFRCLIKWKWKYNFIYIRQKTQGQ